MNVQNLTNFINSIADTDLNSIKIEKQNTKILVNKIKVHQQQYKKNILIQDSKKYEHQRTKNNEIKKNNKEHKIKIQQKDEEKTKHSTSSIYSTIVSPMVGTFYKSPAPNETAFVEIGDTVKPKQTVCIIEAMKLMNEIESEVSGEVVEILIKDGDIVDCGQALIKIKV
uniref:Biotin carboxyl carrier protein of acetyl-CoA carboxylase n=1 Tax=Lophosiphonia teges TaxID=2007110 RepID=A0A1Z1MVY3_9FLOR|nr:acetyl-CoA carboxylase biotin carboxyl carrier protein [Polysiphonia teges]